MHVDLPVNFGLLCFLKLFISDFNQLLNIGFSHLSNYHWTLSFTSMCHNSTLLKTGRLTFNDLCLPENVICSFVLRVGVVACEIISTTSDISCAKINRLVSWTLCLTDFLSMCRLNFACHLDYLYQWVKMQHKSDSLNFLQKESHVFRTLFVT